MSSETPPSTSGSPQSPERRASDRRKAQPFTWEAADFVVVDATQEPDKKVVRRTTVLDGKASSAAGKRHQDVRAKRKIGGTKRKRR